VSPVASPPAKPLDATPGFVIVGATVFDGDHFRQGNVHVRGATIAGFVDAPPPAAEVIDAKGRTLLPGLIDGHIHIGDNVDHLERALSFGVTTVIDLFGPPDLIGKLRATDLAPEGAKRAALFGAGTLATLPKGHGTEYGIPIPTIERPEEERGRLGKDRHEHDEACSKGRLRLVGEAAKAGVKLIAGPDSPNRRIPVSASLLAELSLMHQAGASIEQALASATSHPADAYRIKDRGRIAADKRADLLLVEGNVRASIEAVFHTRTVWKAGAVASRRQ
jgi:imidazolonepropionase-like amidohydrolase